MPLIFCTIAKTGRVTRLRDWYGAKIENINISLLELFNAFAAGELDEFHQPLDEDEVGGGKLLTVSVGKSKDDLTSVSKSATVLDISPNNYVRFMLSDFSNNSNMVDSTQVQHTEPNVTSFLMNARSELIVPPRINSKKFPGLVKLKNTIFDWIEEEGLGWTLDNQTDAWSFVNGLSDALWPIDKNHATLESRGCSIPLVFKQRFSGLRKDVEAKKRPIDESRMSEEKLREYSQRLFDILSAPYMKKSIWKEIRDTIAILANSMSNYCTYLQSQAKRVSKIFLENIYIHIYSNKY
jgi:hypothetical protein